MNSDHATAVLALLEAGWPRGPWPEDTENLWLRHLVSYGAEESKAAVEWMLTRKVHTPTMADWSEAIGVYRAEARRRADEARSLPSGSRAPAPELAQGIRSARRAVAHLEHDHRSRDEAGRPTKCPLCSAHDHTDTRLAGWDRGGNVACWELSCPRCGDPHQALSRWTPEGIAVARVMKSTSAPATQDSMDLAGTF